MVKEGGGLDHFLYNLRLYGKIPTSLPNSQLKGEYVVPTRPVVGEIITLEIQWLDVLQLICCGAISISLSLSLSLSPPPPLLSFPHPLAEAAAREAALSSNALHSEYAPPPPSVIAPSRQSGAAEARMQMIQQEEEEGKREISIYRKSRNFHRRWQLHVWKINLTKTHAHYWHQPGTGSFLQKFSTWKFIIQKFHSTNISRSTYVYLWWLVWWVLLILTFLWDWHEITKVCTCKQ